MDEEKETPTYSQMWEEYPDCDLAAKIRFIIAHLVVIALVIGGIIIMINVFVYGGILLIFLFFYSDLEIIEYQLQVLDRIKI